MILLKTTKPKSDEGEVIGMELKKVCPKCGHTLANGICRNCFLKDVENADKAIQEHKAILKKADAEVKQTVHRAIGFLILILLIVFFIGFGIGCFVGLH